MPQKKNKVIEWINEYEEAFRKLKEICTIIPILAYADFAKPFKWHTDACTLGLGAILYQNQDGVDHIIGYANRSLNKLSKSIQLINWNFWPASGQSWSNFMSTCMAIILSCAQIIIPPHMFCAKLDATGHHWVAGLANYNFALNYHSGTINVDADALSHIPKEEYHQHIEADSVCALISQAIQGTTLMKAYSCNVQITETLDMQKDPKAMSVKDWIITQNKDPKIREIKYLINNKRLKERKLYSQDPQIIKQYLRQHSHLVLRGASSTDRLPLQREIEMHYS